MRILIMLLLTKYQIFKKLPQISHVHKKRIFKSIIVTFYTNYLFPINIVTGTCKESTFSFLPVVSC